MRAKTAQLPAVPKLVEVLRALPERELEGLVRRNGIKIDAAKRLDPPAQVARLLVNLPELRDISKLPPHLVDLIHRMAEARGTLTVATLPSGLEQLVARGLVFARSTKGGFELIFPAAYIVLLKPWEAEDPRGIRALLAQTSADAQAAVASNYLGRSAPPPIALTLEGAYEILTDPVLLAAEIQKLPPSERRVLDNVEAEGGEVFTEELLELEREPLRLRTAAGAAPSRRGVGFALERRGLLVPLHPNRHVVPSEVSRIINANALAEGERRRKALRNEVLSEDHAPRRARFAKDPAPIALALALGARELNQEVRPGVGTPKSLIQKFSARFGREPEACALLIALSRSSGLWDVGALNPNAAPGSLTLAEVPKFLFDVWRRGGVWDEARAEPETLRIAEGARDASPAHLVRGILLSALKELGEERWIPWSSLAEYIERDVRIPGITRLFRRWSDRSGQEATDPVSVAHRMVTESLPSLGIVDLGDEDGEGGNLTLRLTPRGRRILAEKAEPDTEDTRSRFLDSHVLRLASGARVAQILGLGPFVEVGKLTEGLDLIVAPQTLARAISAGFEAEALRKRIESVAKLPDTLSRTLEAASVIVGRIEFAAAAGFLWIEDENVRELLRTRRATADLFVEPSPRGGLLLQAGIDIDKLVRRARTVGIEVVHEGQVLRTKTLPPPPVKTTPSGGVRMPSNAPLPRLTPFPTTVVLPKEEDD
ncbi:MAG: hypothetical protein U0174_02340 [Polyangiaceae bacterium]